MANQIDRDAFVKRDVLKNPIPYTRGTDLLPIVIHFRDFQIPSGATARVFVAKADGNAVYTTATIDGNDVTVDVTDQMFIELGTALMQISIMDGEEELVSFVQPVDVQQNLKAGDLPASTTDVKFLDEAIEQANEAVNTATTAAQQAATAVQNANQAIEDANDAISNLNTQIASLNTNFASLANNVNIPQLDTTAKTLVGAIDELNSKSYSLRGGTSIPANSDLNNYTTPGNYYCSSSNTTPTLINAPFKNSAFVLKVLMGNGTNYPTQVYEELITGKKAYRCYASEQGGWKDYTYFSDDATLPLPLMNTMKKIHTGWIRVAKYQAESVTVAQGSKGYGALLTIKSFYSNRYPVYYIISFHAGHQISGFTILDSYKGNGILQNIRHTVDANTDTAYIELNISDAASENNSITVTILDNIDGSGDNKWVSVNAEATNESVSGVTVVSSLSLQ